MSVAPVNEVVQQPEDDADFEMIEVTAVQPFVEEQPGLPRLKENDQMICDQKQMAELPFQKEENIESYLKKIIMDAKASGTSELPREEGVPRMRFEHSVIMNITQARRKKQKVFHPSEPKDLANYLRGVFFLMEPGDNFEANLHTDDKLLMGYLLMDLQRDSSLEIEFTFAMKDQSFTFASVGFLKGAAEGAGVACITSASLVSISHGLSCLAVGALAPISITLAGITVPIIVIAMVAGGLIYGVVKGYKKYKEGKKYVKLSVVLKPKTCQIRVQAC